MREQVGLAAQFGRSGCVRSVERVRGGAPVVEGRAEVVEVDAGEAIERRTLLGRPGQPQLVGLAVHGEQPLGELAEHGDRRRRPADVGARRVRPR